MQVKHKSFNPSSDYPGYPTQLSRLCEAMESDGWELFNIIAHNQYEHIAVFHRRMKVE